MKEKVGMKKEGSKDYAQYSLSSLSGKLFPNDLFSPSHAFAPVLLSNYGLLMYKNK